MNGAFVELRGITKRYGERAILDGIGLSLEAGRGYVLTGENGSGKSTLLRILSGLDPAEGRLLVDGRGIALTRYPIALRREIVYVHQHPYLFHTSLEHNIAYGLKARGMPAANWKPKVEAAIDWARLRMLLNSPPHKFSGGEKQRAALARAKVLEPRLLLLDEPTANLDAESRGQVLELIVGLCIERKTTILVACHDRELIELPGVARLHLEAGKIKSR